MPDVIYGKKSESHSQLKLKDIMTDWHYSNPTERSKAHVNFIEMNKDSANQGVNVKVNKI